MIRNYFKIAWRQLVKNKIFSFINIIGLASGLTCFLLISLYVLDELSFDKHFANVSRIYRINSDIRFGGADLHMPVTSDMMGEALKSDYPQVEQYTRIYNFNGNKFIKKGSSYITEKAVAHVDSTFFRVFQVPGIEGDLNTSLSEPHTVVLTQSAAEKYFGTTHVVGKVLNIKDEDGEQVYKVTAVISDLPENSHFKFDFLFSMKDVRYTFGQPTSHNFYTYLLLKPGTDYKQFEKNFPSYTEKYVLPAAKQYVNINSMAEFEQAGNKLEYSLTPLTDIHLRSNRSFELRAPGSIQYVYIFSAVALFILIIGCINFMNLTTARSANRAKEVGIRKVLGTEKKVLIMQFLFESTVMVIISLLLALVVAYLVLPLFNEMANKKISFSSLYSSYILALLILLPFVVGLMSGSYPAFYLSGFKPIQVLKGQLKTGGANGSLRSVLVVFQFTTSIILIIGTIVVYRQLDYIRNTNVGFEKDQVLIIDGTNALHDNLQAFKNEVLQLPGIMNGTISSYIPVANSSRNDNTFSTEAVLDSRSGFDMQNWYVDYDYVKTMGMQIARGRNFSRDFGTDSSAVIINETTARIIGHPDPVGKQIFQAVGNGQVKPLTIIGVVKNFNYETLHSEVGPLALLLGNYGVSASFKIGAATAQSVIPQVEKIWKSMAPGIPFSYRFMDESFNRMYRAEQRVGKLAITFSVLAILIACLGLFGLATFVAEQRRKEIGIRKVLGASVNGIVALLSKDFVRLVIISFVVAAPVAWFVMNHWLRDFAYRISISWWIFVLAGIIALAIALFTVSFQSVRAALSNPVKNLRTE